MATLVVAPYLALATGFLLLGHAISRGTLGGFLLALLDIFLWMVPWGLLALVTLLVLVAALFFRRRTRALASAALAGIAAASLAVIVAVPAGIPDAGQLVFLLPCAAAGAVGAWNLAKK